MASKEKKAKQKKEPAAPKMMPLGDYYDYSLSLQVMGEDMLKFGQMVVDKAKTNLSKAQQLEHIGMCEVDAKNESYFMRIVDATLYGICSKLFDVYKILESVYKSDDGCGAEASDGTGEGGLYNVYQEKDLIVVQTPYLHKNHCYSTCSYSYVIALESRAFRSFDKELFTAQRMDTYLCNVFPAETPPHKVFDPDNTVLKTTGDAIMCRLNMDDNGYVVREHVYTILTDEVPAGTYTVVVPRKETPLSDEELLGMIWGMIFDRKERVTR